MAIDGHVLVTGGAGFIGSHVVRLFVKKYPDYLIVNLDALTYAGNLENLSDIEHEPNYKFVKADITDAAHISSIFQQYKPDGIIHLAAESHVDRSISDPNAFLQTNIMGTANLLNAARICWKGKYDKTRFYHVSTDEVYGSLGETGFLGIFLCPLLDLRPFPKRPPPFAIIVLYRWLTCRIMLGAGLIKIRGDEVWRNSTAL